MSDIGYGIPPAPDISILGQYSEREIRRLRHDLYNAKNEDMTFWGTVEFDNTTQAIKANSAEFSNVIIDGSCDISQRLHCWSGVQIDGTSTFGNKIRFDEFSGEIIDTTELNTRFLYVQKFMGLGKFCVSSGVDISGIGFVDRGNPAVHDFSRQDLTGTTYDPAVGGWADLSVGTTGSGTCRNLVPVGAKAVLLKMIVRFDAAGSYVRVRGKQAGTNTTNTATVAVPVGGVAFHASNVIGCDSNGELQYLIGQAMDLTSDAAPDSIVFTVQGWWL